MVSVLEQFTAFGTDNVGLERLLRLLQSTALVLAAYPPLLELLFSFYPQLMHADAVATLFQLGGRLNLIRRTMRLFRFLDAFQSSWAASQTRGKSFEVWCDVLSRSFWGMFGLAESATLVDLMDIEHLEIFGADLTAEINYQAQMLWLLALYASALGSGTRILRTLAYRAVPQDGGGYGTGEKPVQEAYSEKNSTSETVAQVADKESTAKEELEKERERLKDIVSKRKQERKAWSLQVGGQVVNLSVKLLADILDMVIPAATLGWIKVEPGFVGAVMFATTILTSIDPWRRCTEQVRSKAMQT
ncbi:hypothetical protein S40285_06908 [Stachybotrys chlorohalonatus IBT 40285]|uniref:Uncharacterized protein n=1 Tax=Stachybotrys chlorohalonatus (strain IBT 40285) TaxID=1283841 RepID=A0A084Q968_STAC4|nr:hypothetical protein S40285_06908 [Stachybotrys chlorohalonata IBT 40285]